MCSIICNSNALIFVIIGVLQLGEFSCCCTLIRTSARVTVTELLVYTGSRGCQPQYLTLVCLNRSPREMLLSGFRDTKFVVVRTRGMRRRKP